MIQESEIVSRQMQPSGINLNVKKILLSIARKWYLYIIGMVISGGGAHYYLQNTIPVYEVATTVLIGEVSPGSGGAGPAGSVTPPQLEEVIADMDPKIGGIAQQILTLKQASIDGVAFCEICEKNK